MNLSISHVAAARISIVIVFDLRNPTTRVFLDNLYYIVLRCWLKE